MKPTLGEVEEENRQRRIDVILGVSGIVIALSLILWAGGT